ncbi:hypothetical protein DERF_014480 [Dermatophagoides farinae]|uniref:Rho-GAP domain-containing protein n=1 Tax=Dermatophagoides farinae TaxID=6954 RepID=A0A922HP73_DERFA|nr:hypothetical protein DERF_014480 [Dermatophagoides farinae]
MFPFFLRNSHHDYSIQRVKFGIPLVDVCSVHNDLPSLLLMMILKLNKEAPHKKDIFRAPGNQANMRKLIQFLQNGRLVNLEQFSVHTIASVLKKFLRKLPNGIFGQQNERLLFDVIGAPTESEEKYLEIQRIIFSLPIVTQHLLVLLFGTFRLIVDSRQSSMTSESLSISVAPSFFHSCIPDGNKFAKLEDVQRFKIASSIMKFIIDNFGIYNLFGQENYGYYSRMTGKIINVEENWTFTFRYPPKNLVPSEACRSIENRWLNDECRKWNLPEFQIDTQRIDENAAAATTLVEDDVDYKGSPHRCRFLKTKTDH